MNAQSPRSRKLLARSVTLSLLSASLAFPKSKGDSVVQITVSDEGKPARRVASLDRLKSEDCAHLFLKEGTPSKEDIERARSCVSHIYSASIDKNGSHIYERLEAGWYRIRLNWPMTNPPASKIPVGCSIDGWSISYVPWKESGKNRGFAQGPAFELKNGETRKIEFDYNGPFKITEDCPMPVKWVHNN